MSSEVDSDPWEAKALIASLTQHTPKEKKGVGGPEKKLNPNARPWLPDCMSGNPAKDENGDLFAPVEDNEPPEWMKKVKARAWLCTWNNYSPEDLINFPAFLKRHHDYSYQEEEAPSTGTPHIQACFYLRNASSLYSLVRAFPKVWFKRVKKGGENWMRCKAYCTKEETSKPDGQRGAKETSEIKIQDPWEEFGNKLYEWQLKLIEELKQKPDRRKVIWFYDLQGHAGKSAFVDGYMLRNEHDTAFVRGKAADCLYIISEKVKKGNPCKTILIDLTRKHGNRAPYDAIESLKGTFTVSGKYESCEFKKNPSHVVVFANLPPVKDALSADRWDIRNITDAKKIPSPMRPSDDKESDDSIDEIDALREQEREQFAELDKALAKLAMQELSDDDTSDIGSISEYLD